LLIAEASAELRKDLRRIFQREFPGIQIDEAETTAEVEFFLKNAVSQDVYAVVILDAKLPSPGEGPGDDALSRLDPFLRKPSQDPPAYFILSTNLDDPKIKERQREIARRQEEYNRQDDQGTKCTGEYAPRQVFFPKSSPGWDIQLRDRARRLIHPRRIKEQIDELLPWFGRKTVVGLAGASARAGYGPGGLRARGGRLAFDPTQRLASLVRDIEHNWRYLGTVQSMVETYFVVRETDEGGVEVGLL
jgi:hypothetical protein